MRRRVIIHTEAGAVRATNASLHSDAEHMRSIDAFHFGTRGWKGGVGYNFVIERTGRIFEGRGYDYVGGHTAGLNGELGICFAGHGDNAPATSEQWSSARWLIHHSVVAGFLVENYLISGHRDHIPPGQKSCPGNLIYPLLWTELGHDRPLFPPNLEDDDMPGPADWTDVDWVRFAAAMHDTVVRRVTGSNVGINEPVTNLGDIANLIMGIDPKVTITRENLDQIATLLRDGLGEALAAELAERLRA
jgi:hypothetical protein